MYIIWSVSMQTDIGVFIFNEVRAVEGVLFLAYTKGDGIIAALVKCEGMEHKHKEARREG